VTSAKAARRVWAVVPAAGRGERFESPERAAAGSPEGAPARALAASPEAAPAAGRSPKQYAELCGATVIEWSLRALLAESRIEKVVVVLAAEDVRWAALPLAGHPKILTATGGAGRQHSVMNGLKRLAALAAPDDWVLVHDAARPCLERDDVRALIDALDGAGCGAVLAAPVVDTVKREHDGYVGETVDRAGLWRALTPQVFGLAALERALEEAVRLDIQVTDEAQAMERLGLRARLVAGSAFNVKVTRAADLAAAARILRSAGRSANMRVGQGFDVHTFGAGDHVMLGGVRIAHHRGVVAHSDGDVVIHALCDAVLGALGEGDIGRHFPDSDPKYRGVDSRVFLRRVAEMMRAAGLKLVNADITVLAEAPRVAAHRSAMAANLAADLGASEKCINVKATTTERLGFVGRGEGLAAQAAVLLDAS
jgi:2-C-methyl-D-erythritol 4-phosphate cytidylyltransferase/2-C-methyl-D-erythritol 2,4-cyclodiphosphate synthase